MPHISIRLTDMEKSVISSGAALPPRQSINRFMVESAIAATNQRVAIYKDVINQIDDSEDKNDA